MQNQRRSFLLMLIGAPALLSIAAFAARAWRRSALRSVKEMALRAREINPDTLTSRFATGQADAEAALLARELNALLSRIEGAFERFRRFASDCPHEIRTPLAIIRNLGELALQTNLTPAEYRNSIGSMLEEVEGLISLLDALLLLTRAEDGNVPLQKASVPVMALAGEVADLFEIITEEKSLTLVLDGDKGIEVEADRVILKQALVNVVHNALTYSPDSERVTIRAFSQNGNQVTLEVEDHGPGIPPNEQGRIFDRLYRGSRARNGNSSGAGLGLAIAKWAVEVNGGTISVLSKAGEGCTFRITLPQMLQIGVSSSNWSQRPI